MKRKKILASAVSFILLFSIITTLTACSNNDKEPEVIFKTEDEIEPLPDNFVDYTDATNGVSYTYNNAYVMSFGNDSDLQEIKDYNTDFYNQLYKDRRSYVARYEDARYYPIRTNKNEFNSNSSTFIYTVDTSVDADINISEISDEDYELFSNNIKSHLESSMGDVESDTSQKYLTFGANEYLHFKYTFDMIGRPYIYEEFVFQLEDGTVCEFIFHAYESQYDFAFEQVSKILESMKVN